MSTLFIENAFILSERGSNLRKKTPILNTHFDKLSLRNGQLEHQ